MLILGNLILLLAARLLWNQYPGLWVCGFFWALFAALVINRLRHGITPETFLFALGGGSNALVTLANNGRMPVLFYQGAIGGYGPWVQATSSSHFLWLCDRFDGFSIGDFIMLSAIPVLFISLLCFFRNCGVERSGSSPDTSPEAAGSNPAPAGPV